MSSTPLATVPQHFTGKPQEDLKEVNPSSYQSAHTITLAVVIGSGAWQVTQSELMQNLPVLLQVKSIVSFLKEIQEEILISFRWCGIRD